MKPKYNFFKNTIYALSGLKAMLNESSFRIEIAFILPLLILSYFLEISIEAHILLVITLIGILIAECLNTAIEACVDLITKEFHPLAKIAKDTGSAAVMLSITAAVVSWSIVFFEFILKF
jgi:diacylglycerol kinase